MTTRNRLLLAAIILVPAGLTVSANAMGERHNGPVTAEATLINPQSRPIGTAVLTQLPTGVKIRLDATNLPPGTLAFHIHQTGICDPATGFSTAGSHFNPGNKAHGHEAPGGAHAGDMMNLNVAPDGTLHTEVLNPGVTLDDTATGLLDADGAALVIHAKPDDYTSQPAGAAGDRIACGIIKPAR